MERDANHARMNNMVVGHAGQNMQNADGVPI